MKAIPTVITALTLVGMLAPATARAQAAGASQPVLYVNNSYKSCYCDLHPELTEAEFKEFATELGSILRFRQLGDATTLGQGRFDISLQFTSSSIDDAKGACNNPMSHPDARITIWVTASPSRGWWPGSPGSHTTTAALRLVAKRVDRLQERKPVKVGVTRADAANAVLAHEHGGLRVMHNVAREPGHFGDHVRQHSGMTIGRYQDTQSRGLLKGVKKTRAFVDRPGMAHDTSMRHHAEKLVADAPGEIPGAVSGAPLFDERAAPRVFRRTFVCGIDEDVRVDHEHQRPSIARYRASRSARSASAPPLLKLGRGESSTASGRDCNSRRNAVSTSSDIVRPVRADSRFNLAMTPSSIINVVFIWKTISMRWTAVNPRTVLPQLETIQTGVRGSQVGVGSRRHRDWIGRGFRSAPMRLLNTLEQIPERLLEFNLLHGNGAGARRILDAPGAMLGIGSPKLHAVHLQQNAL